MASTKIRVLAYSMVFLPNVVNYRQGGPIGPGVMGQTMTMFTDNTHIMDPEYDQLIWKK